MAASLTEVIAMTVTEYTHHYLAGQEQHLAFQQQHQFAVQRHKLTLAAKA